jgi:lycopene cyclase domain-containing protein
MSTYGVVLLICVALTAPLDIVFKLRVYARPLLYLQAVWLPAFVFLVWDVIATHYDHWAFSTQHVSDVKVAGLPFEEYLFFFIVPLCAVLTYGAVRKLHPASHENRAPVKAWLIFSFVYLALGVVVQYFWSSTRDGEFPDRFFPWYSAATLVSVIAMIVWLRRSEDRQHIVSRYDMFWTLVICLSFMVGVNGFLTKLNDPVVSYAGNLGPRIFFDIPIEDFFYGSVLLIWTLIRYERKTRTS